MEVGTKIKEKNENKRIEKNKLCLHHEYSAFFETVPNLGDLTTDEYSFVIKCPASRHLPVRRKNSSALQGDSSFRPALTADIQGL